MIVYMKLICCFFQVNFGHQKDGEGVLEDFLEEVAEWYIRKFRVGIIKLKT